jgi:hypothetical protein
MTKPGYLKSFVEPRIVRSREETELKLMELADTPERRLGLYQFYQTRIETIRTRLWTMLAWIAAADAGILAFISKELHANFAGIPSVGLTLEQPLPTLIIAGFGVVLSTYMLHVIDDGSGHIESNWRRSDLVLGKEHIHEITRDRRARRQNHAFAWLMSYVAQSLRLVHSIVVLIAFLVLYEKWSGFSFSSIK